MKMTKRDSVDRLAHSAYYLYDKIKSKESTDCKGGTSLYDAMLALEKGRLPRSLHFKTPNPDIAFSELNLAVASEPIELQQGRQPRVAGINSFGFGGTNAHAIIAEPDAPARGKGRNRSVVPAEVRRRQGAANPIVVLSATSGPALADLARDYIRLLDGDARADVAALAQNIGHFRDLLPERAALLATNRAELRDDLAALAAEAESPGVVTGRSADAAARAVFVFSGNGSQWAGMGRAALSRNPAFKASLEATDRIFSRLSRWSLVEALGAPDLAERLRSTVTAQPLLLALQIAAVAGLKEFGIEPDAVLGHSVGEVAAAYVSGALSLDDAVEIIVARSTCQEPVRNSGAMATLRLGEHDAAEAIAASGLKGIEIAAINSPASVTISGPRPNVESFCRFAESNGLATRLLDLEYPFHCALVDPVRKPLLRALEGLGSRPTRIPFISTVTGRVHPGEELGAPYWWDNVRAPVRFGRAIETAYGLGDRLFIEIGPRPVLQSYMRECLAGDAIGDSPFHGDKIVPVSLMRGHRGAVRRSPAGILPVMDHQVAVLVSPGVELVDPGKRRGVDLACDPVR